ncbi:IS110 family transposase [Paraflavitalea speifideaquila]|uniref:IS110 family transposase n=1 Tax=Paraflavitalea speifideaquila TaxID=3076558 RepID=UPI003313048D
MPTSDKENKRKTDKVDSRKIAKGLKNRQLNAIYIPNERQEADRLLLRARANIVRDVTMVKNRIKAFLKINGISVPDSHKNGNWTKSFITWLQSLKFAEVAWKASFDVYIGKQFF